MDTVPLDNSIKLKSCPRCLTAIRRSLRYGNVIKQQLQNIEEVKKKVIGHSSELEEAKERLRRHLIDLTKTFDQGRKMQEWKWLERRVERMSRGIMAAVTENQVTLMERYCRLSDKLKQSLLNDVARREASSESRLEGKTFPTVFINPYDSKKYTKARLSIGGHWVFLECLTGIVTVSITDNNEIL